MRQPAGLELVGETLEVVLQKLLVERYVGEFQKIVFEIVEVPKHGLSVESLAGIGVGEIHLLAAGLHGHQPDYHFMIKVFGLFVETLSGCAFGNEHVVKRLIAQILLQIGLAVGRNGIYFGDFEPFFTEKVGVVEKRLVFAHIVVYSGDAYMVTAFQAEIASCRTVGRNLVFFSNRLVCPFFEKFLHKGLFFSPLHKHHYGPRKSHGNKKEGEQRKFQWHPVVKFHANKDANQHYSHHFHAEG